MTFFLFRQLDVIPKSHDLVLDVYRQTNSFPSHEQFGLVSQLRRAAVSIPTNVSEGKGRESDRELARFLLIARGSLREVQYLLKLSLDLGYLSEESHSRLQSSAEEINRMMGGMLSKLHCHPIIIRTQPKKKAPRKDM
jgi:four helix bundle protein